MRILGYKIFYKKVTKCKYLIFDKENYQYLVEILKNKNYDFIDIRNNKINLFYFFSINYFKTLFKTRKIKFTYIASIVNFHNPNLVITYMDNNRIFYELSLISEGVKFIAIQNGNHFFCFDRDKNPINRHKKNYFQLSSRFYPVTYLSIGNYERYAYPKYCKFIFKEIIPIGSLASAYRFYNNKTPSINLTPEYDIGLIGNSMFKMKKIGEDDSILLSHLRKFINEKKDLKIFYISKFYEQDNFFDKEKKYLKEYFNEQVIIYSRDEKDSLDLCTNCNLVIGTISTLLRELYSIGIKIYSTNTLPYPHKTVYEIINYKNFPDYITFKNNVINLLNMSRKEFFEQNYYKDIDFNTESGETAIQKSINIINK